MTVQKVTLVLDVTDGTETPVTAGKAYFAPSAVLALAGELLATQHPVAVDLAGTAPLEVDLIPTDTMRGSSTRALTTRSTSATRVHRLATRRPCQKQITATGAPQG